MAAPIILVENTVASEAHEEESATVNQGDTSELLLDEHSKDLY